MNDVNDRCRLTGKRYTSVKEMMDDMGYSKETLRAYDEAGYEPRRHPEGMVLAARLVMVLGAIIIAAVLIWALWGGGK